MAGWVAEVDANGFARIGARYLLPLVASAAIALPFLALYTFGLWIADYHDDVGRFFFWPRSRLRRVARPGLCGRRRSDFVRVLGFMLHQPSAPRLTRDRAPRILV